MFCVQCDVVLTLQINTCDVDIVLKRVRCGAAVMHVCMYVCKVRTMFKYAHIFFLLTLLFKVGLPSPSLKNRHRCVCTAVPTYLDAAFRFKHMQNLKE